MWVLRLAIVTLDTHCKSCSVRLKTSKFHVFGLLNHDVRPIWFASAISIDLFVCMCILHLCLPLSSFLSTSHCRPSTSQALAWIAEHFLRSQKAPFYCRNSKTEHAFHSQDPWWYPKTCHSSIKRFFRSQEVFCRHWTYRLPWTMKCLTQALWIPRLVLWASMRTCFSACFSVLALACVLAPIFVCIRFRVCASVRLLCPGLQLRSRMKIANIIPWLYPNAYAQGRGWSENQARAERARRF